MGRLPCSAYVPKFSDEFDENKIINDRKALNQMLHKPFQADFSEVAKIDADLTENIFTKNRRKMWGKR